MAQALGSSRPFQRCDLSGVCHDMVLSDIADSERYHDTIDFEDSGRKFSQSTGNLQDYLIGKREVFGGCALFRLSVSD